MEEGYVKYTASHENSPVPRTPVWEQLNETRTKCFNLGLVGVYPNGIGYGNLSVRFSGDQFIISGTATGAKQVLSDSDYCLVKSFDIARNNVESRGLVQASSESMTHGAVYRARQGVNCVIHIHSRKIFDNMLCGGYPFTQKEAAYGTPDIALAIENCVNDSAKDEGQIVLAGHDEGIIAYGENVERAFFLIMELYNKYIGG
ncbi:MAG: class II aldolase/adducin family protein [Treponema sp.]|nr:class II aldolase/adducin family protein [Treponema sp.]